MGSTGSNFVLIINREGLTDKLEQLSTCPDWSERLRRIEGLLGSHSYGERQERMKWQTTFRKWLIADISLIEKNEFYQILNSPEDSPENARLSRHLRLEMQFGQVDNRYPQSEQLFFTLHFSHLHWQTIWLKPHQYLVRFELPTRGMTVQPSQNAARPLIGLALEILQPIFGFAYPDNNYIVERMHQAKVYDPPWNYYWHTIVFGAELTQQIGVEKLRSLTAFRTIELGELMFWLSSPKGLGDESFYYQVSPFYYQYDYAIPIVKYTDGSLRILFQQALNTHKDVMITNLGLQDSE
jgi:hypothetical protein